jgi:hypothetical protein
VFSQLQLTLFLCFYWHESQQGNVSRSIEDVIRASLELQGIDVAVGSAKISGNLQITLAQFHSESYVKKDA